MDDYGECPHCKRQIIITGEPGERCYFCDELIEETLDTITVQG